MSLNQCLSVCNGSSCRDCGYKDTLEIVRDVEEMIFLFLFPPTPSSFKGFSGEVLFVTNNMVIRQLPYQCVSDSIISY